MGLLDLNVRKKQFKHDGNMRNHLEMRPGCEDFEETLTSIFQIDILVKMIFLQCELCANTNDYKDLLEMHIINFM